MEAPRECCGLLIGTPARVAGAVALENVAADAMRRYEIAPADHAALIRRCRGRADGTAVVGAYHSHPRTAAEPSPTDVAEAFSCFWFLIAGPVSSGVPLELRAFHLVEGHLLEEPLVISDAPPPPAAPRPGR